MAQAVRQEADGRSRRQGGQKAEGRRQKAESKKQKTKVQRPLRLKTED